MDGVSHTTYADGGDLWTVEVDTTTPDEFGKVGPADGAVLADGAVTLNWMASADSGSGLSQYEVCYDSVVNGTCTGGWTSAGLTTSAALALADGAYEWQVRAVDGVSHTTYADSDALAVWTFRVDTTAPDGFDKTGPADGAVLAEGDVTLSWEASADGGSGLSRYEVCYDSAVNGSWTGGGTSVGLTTSSALALADGAYEWQVRAVDGVSHTTYADGGDIWTLRVDTTAPDEFDKVGPADGVVLATGNVTLNWNVSSDSGSGSGLSRYEYCYDTTINGVCTGGWTSVGLTTSAALVLADGEYEWQVRAVDGASLTTDADYEPQMRTPARLSSANAVWMFRVDTGAPGAFGKAAPANGSMLASGAVALEWSASADSGSGLDRYEYCYDTTVDATCTGVWTSAGLTTSVALILADGEYEWQIRAVDSVSNTTHADGGTVWAFTVDTGAPSATIDPLSGCSAGPEQFAGTASDGGMGGSGLSHVELQLVRQSDGQYWDGATYQAGAAWFVATGNITWTYTLPQAAISMTGEYELFSRAVDLTGNTQTPPAQANFRVDHTGPTWPASSTFSPLDGQVLGSAPTLIWDEAFDGGCNQDIVYSVYLDSDGPVTTTSRIMPSNLIGDVGNGAHIWRVEARDGLGNGPAYSFGSSSATRAFTLQDAVLTVVVYHDDNPRNGQLDAAEIGRVQNATIQVNNLAPAQTPTDGALEYANLPAGVIRVQRLANPADWLSTSADEVQLAVQAGLAYTVTFGATHNTGGVGLVYGSVFSDTNRNGARDAGEIGLPGITINLNGVGMRTTDDVGNYTFGDVPPGDYFIDQTDLPGFFSTTPNRLTVQVNGGASHRRDFADVYDRSTGQGQIIGLVFDDANRNGQLDAAESGIDGARVNVDGAAVETANGGMYSVVVAPGLRVVSASIPAGYAYATTPNPASGEVDADATTTIHFGVSVNEPFPVVFTKQATNLYGGSMYHVGDVVRYDIALLNTGLLTHTNVRFTDALPSAILALSSVELSAEGASSESANLLITTWPILAPGASVTASVYATLTAIALDQVITNTAWASSDAMTPHEVVASAGIGPVQSSLLAGKTGQTSNSSGHVRLGDVVTYTVWVHNASASADYDITISDTHPAALDLVRVMTEPDSGSWRVESETPAYRIVYPGPLAPDETVSLTLVYTAARVGQSIANTATITSASHPTEIGVTAVAADGPVIDTRALEASKMGQIDLSSGKQHIVFTLFVKNPNDVTVSAQVTDVLPAGLVVVSGTLVTNLSPAPVVAPDRVTWDGTLDAGQTLAIQFATTASVGGWHTNTVQTLADGMFASSAEAAVFVPRTYVPIAIMN